MLRMEVEVPAPASTPVKSVKEQSLESWCMMGLPYVTSFCCCMGLEVGARVIALAHFIVSISLMIVCARFATDARAFVGTVEDAEDHLYSTVYKIAVTMTMVTLVHLALAATLLYASFKRNTVALRVWLILMSALCVCSLLYIVVSVAMFGIAYSGFDVLFAILQGVVFFGVVGYCILVVYSYYRMLRSNEELDKPTKVDYD